MSFTSCTKRSLPLGTYLVQVIDLECTDQSNESNFSTPLGVSGPVWGDTLGDCSSLPCSPADGIVNITDVAGVIGRFGSQPGSIAKSRADLEPGCLDLIINITDVLSGVSGFQGLVYPFAPSAPTPCGSICPNPLPQ